MIVKEKRRVYFSVLLAVSYCCSNHSLDTFTNPSPGPGCGLNIEISSEDCIMLAVKLNCWLCPFDRHTETSKSTYLHPPQKRLCRSLSNQQSSGLSVGPRAPVTGAGRTEVVHILVLSTWVEF